MALAPSATDTIGIHGAGSTSPLNYAGLTTLSGDTDLVVFMVFNSAFPTITLNWDSAGTPQLMTQVGSASNGASDSAGIYWLASPHVGNLNLAITFTGSVVSYNISAMSFQGGGGGTASGTTATGNTSPGGVTVPSAGGHYTMFVAGTNSGIFNAPTGATQLFRNTSAEAVVAGYQAGSASNTMSSTFSGGPFTWAAIGCDLLPVSSGGGGASYGNMTMMGVGHHKGLGWTPLLDRRSRVFRRPGRALWMPNREILRPLKKAA